MNVLYKTTNHVSIGDDIAFFGTKKVMNHVLPGHNCFLYTGRSEKDVWKAGTDIDVDLVVIAGTPVWTGPQMAALEEFIIKENKPVLYMGVGMLYAKTDRTEAALKNSIGFIARDNTAFKRAQKTTDAKLFCCPSIFAVDAAKELGSKIGIIPQVDTFLEKQVKLIDKFDKKDVLIICNELVDYIWAAKNLPEHEVVYSRVLEDMCGFYTRCSKIFSMRIHGAHLAYALGIPTVCIKNEKDKSVTCRQIGVNLVDPLNVTDSDLAYDPSIKRRMYSSYVEYVRGRLKATFPRL